MPDVQTKEPLKITAGESVFWSRRLSDFDSIEWNLCYSLAPKTGGTATAIQAAKQSGGSWLVELGKDVTANLGSGVYCLRGWVENESYRFSVPEVSCELEVLPNPFSDTAEDQRTKAERMVDLIESAIEDLVSKKVTQTTVQGNTYTFQNIGELQSVLKYWKREVSREYYARNPGARNIRLRF